jgi:hypothetical protein
MTRTRTKLTETNSQLHQKGILLTALSSLHIFDCCGQRALPQKNQFLLSDLLLREKDKTAVISFDEGGDFARNSSGEHAPIATHFLQTNKRTNEEFPAIISQRKMCCSYVRRKGREPAGSVD